MSPVKGIPADFVLAIWSLRRQGKKLREVSELTGKSIAWCRKILTTRDRFSGPKKANKRGPDNSDIFVDINQDDPNTTVSQMRAKIEDQYGISASRATVFRRARKTLRSVNEVADELTATCKKKQVEWCKKLLKNLESDPDFFNQVWFCDEASFDLEGTKRKCVFSEYV